MALVWLTFATAVVGVALVPRSYCSAPELVWTLVAGSSFAVAVYAFGRGIVSAVAGEFHLTFFLVAGLATFGGVVGMGLLAGHQFACGAA